MKKKQNPIVIIIIILVLVFAGLMFYYFKPTSTSTKTSTTTTNSDTTTTSVITTSIENTLSSSGQISSALDEKVKLHASYYFEELLVDENVYIKEGTNIVEYTNGTYLTAPYDCVLISSELPNEDEICTTSHYVEIESIDTLSMSLSISETEIDKVEVGDEVDVTITASSEKITGYITAISEVGTYSSSGSYFTATVTFDNPGNLKIGMSASCEIILDRVENVLAVPQEAVQTSDDGSYVIVVDDNGNTSNVTVETGISNDAYVEIKSGLTGSEKVQMSTESSSSSSSSGFNFKGGSGMPSMPGGSGFSGGSEMPSGMPSGMPNF